jgi:formylglycine-generating enzyme required for sulfatase activity
MNQRCIRGVAFAGLLFATGVQAVTIDLVLVGNPRNRPDTEVMDQDGTTHYGAVPYEYEIGKYEITAGQYTEFLNAVAKDDPNGLYDYRMASIPFKGANIQQSGSSPNFSYSVAPDFANRPVNFVTFWDAARFCNWLHNGQPTGPQGPGTTDDGSYINIGNQATFARTSGATYVLPTENEWYKAAYHDQSAGTAAVYFDFPTSSNLPPGRSMTETTNPGNNANYEPPFANWLLGPPYYRTNVGEFELSDSPYGTFDQGGNIWEWNESVILSHTRGLRGGSFSHHDEPMYASYRHLLAQPFGDDPVIGFRVARVEPVPEPGTVAPLFVAALGLLAGPTSTRRARSCRKAPHSGIPLNKCS